MAFGSVPAVSVRTAEAPAVVRFRPRAGDEVVERTAAISVRFTERMDRDRTAEAFHVTVGSSELKGAVSWAEQGRVLVFVPADPLPYGATVRARVDDTAVSKAGTPLAKASTATFTVEPKPKPKPKAKAAAPRAAAQEEQAQADPQVGRWRGRLRQLGRRGVLLPAADELHPDRRLGHVGRASAPRPADATWRRSS